MLLAAEEGTPHAGPSPALAAPPSSTSKSLAEAGDTYGKKSRAMQGLHAVYWRHLARTGAGMVIIQLVYSSTHKPSSWAVLALTWVFDFSLWLCILALDLFCFWVVH